MSEAAKSEDYQLLRSLLAATLFAIALQCTLSWLFPTDVPPGAHDLRPQGCSAWIDFLLWLVVFDLSVVIIELGYKHIDARPLLRWAGRMVLVIPLVAGSLALVLTRFVAIEVDPQGVTLIRNLSLGKQSFAFHELGQVEVEEQQLWDELLFRCHDRVESSVFVYHFDPAARRQLAEAANAIRREGVTVTVKRRKR